MRAPNCTHPVRSRKRDNVELTPGQWRVAETCGVCGAERHYFRDDGARTMSEFPEWPRRQVPLPESR